MVDNNAMSTDVVLSNDPDGAYTEEFNNIYLKYSERIVEFLENSVETGNNRSMINNILLDQHLHVWSTLKDKEDFREVYEEKIVKLLQNSEVHYDKDQALIVCLMLNFKPGILYLCEERKLYRPILHYHISQKDMDSAINFCRKFGTLEPRLWVEMLWNLSSSEHLPEVLDFITNNKLLPPSLIIDHLTDSTIFTLKDIKKYLNNLLIDEENIQAINRRNESKETTSSSMACQISQCPACSQPLKSPTRHFQCSHSYHQNCLQSFSENNDKCPACEPSNEKLFEFLHNQSTIAGPTVAFHAQLEKEHDGISVIEYIGRKVLSKSTINIDNNIPLENKPNSNVENLDSDASVSVNNPDTSNSFKYGPGAEARMRLKEGTFKKQESRRKGFKSFVSSQNFAQTSKAAPSSFEDPVQNPFYRIPTNTASQNPFENDDDSHNNTTGSNERIFQINKFENYLRVFSNWIKSKVQYLIVLNTIFLFMFFIRLLFERIQIINKPLEPEPEPGLFSKIQNYFK